MEYATRTKINALCVTLTESGELQLLRDPLKELKALLKQADQNVVAVAEFAQLQLRKEHAQIRFSTTQLIGELFNRSRAFREHVVTWFKDFVELTIGPTPTVRLPKPYQFATKTRALALEMIDDWFKTHGAHYKPIQLAYDYLHKTLKLKFPPIDAKAVAQERSAAAREHQATVLLQTKYRKFLADRDRVMAAIDENAQVLENGCAALLEGRVEGAVAETPDNAPVFDSLRDGVKLLDKHLAAVADWMDTLVKVDVEVRAARDKAFRDVLVVRDRLRAIRGACERLFKAEALEGDGGAGAGEDEPMWDEVMPYGELDPPQATTSTLDTLPDAPADSPRGVAERENDELGDAEDDEVADTEPMRGHVGTQEATTHHTVTHHRARSAEEQSHAESGADGESIEDLRRRAKVVPYHTSLYFWGKEAVDLNTSGMERHHRFLGDSDSSERVLPIGRIPAMGMMVSEVHETYVPVTRTCRHPLPNGKLCPRRDREKCPFHGPIVDRDEQGRRADNVEDAPTMPAPSRKRPRPADNAATNGGEPAVEVEIKEEGDEPVAKRPVVVPQPGQTWQDIADEVAAAVGGAPEPRGRKKKPATKLIDIHKRQTTSQSRIEKKLLNPHARKRLAKTLDRQDEMRYRDKFANRW